MNTIKMTFITNDVNGHNFIIQDPNEHIQTFLVNGKYYEQDMIKFIVDNYSGGTFIDVGANIGNHTIAFSDIADDVYSFEPIKENYLILQLNLMINKITNVETYNFALGSSDKFETIYRDDKCYNTGSGSISNPTSMCTTRRYTIVTKLDNFNYQSVKLIKIDVEGYELEVLKGSTKLLETQKPDLFIECITDDKFKQILDFLKPFGYQVWYKAFNATPTMLFTCNIDFLEKINNENNSSNGQ
jgi:FkbM family methyltransferase